MVVKLILCACFSTFKKPTNANFANFATRTCLNFLQSDFVLNMLYFYKANDIQCAAQRALSSSSSSSSLSSSSSFSSSSSSSFSELSHAALSNDF